MRRGNSSWFSSRGPRSRTSARDHSCPFPLNRTQCGLPTLTPVNRNSLPSHRDRLVDQLLCRQGAGKVLRTEGCVSHGDRGRAGLSVAVDVQLHLHEAAEGIDGEAPAACPSGRVQVTPQDAQPVPGLLRFAAVGVVYSDAEVRLAGVGEGEDSVASQTPVAVAKRPDCGRRELEIEIARVEGDVVVSESVPLEESVSHLTSAGIIGCCFP